jgi:glutathione S-transferase
MRTTPEGMRPFPIRRNRPTRRNLMKLYYAPGACSLGIRILMEEIGKPYEATHLDIRAGQEQFKPEFTSINPKSKVPTLVKDNGEGLTEFPAIATYLARTNKDKRLLPDDPDGEARALEAMEYVVSTMHMQGFSRMFRPGNFAPSEADHEAVAKKGREILEKGFKIMDKTLEGKEYLAGEFSIADAALFYIEYFAGGRMKMTLPPNVAAHYQRMQRRPSVAKVIEDEKLAV